VALQNSMSADHNVRVPASDARHFGHDAPILVAMDKFRGTATAVELCDVVAVVARGLGFVPDVQPLSDGGEGFRDAFVGDVVKVRVSGPLGEKVTAGITFVSRDSRRTAILECADAVGRHYLVTPTPEQALAASSTGVGELILAAAEHGADAILLGLGGSATSDGGRGCYEFLRDHGGLPTPVIAATDVVARFSGARRYAHQKGVREEDLKIVDAHLASVRALFLSEQGVDVEALERTGAAGGIAGAIAALGGSLVDGLEAVDDAVGLKARISRVSLVISGEGRFDEGSLEGKVTGGIATMIDGRVPLLLVCGSLDEHAAKEFESRYEHVRIVALSERLGMERATKDVLGALREVVTNELADVEPCH
jgi:glycerate kinase